MKFRMMIDHKNVVAFNKRMTLEESLSITTLRCDLVDNHKDLFMHFPSMSRNGQVAMEGCNGQASSSMNGTATWQVCITISFKCYKIMGRNVIPSTHTSYQATIATPPTITSSIVGTQ